MGVIVHKIAKAPPFGEYTVDRRVVLQCTKLGDNNNKFYNMELQTEKASGLCRVFTHYGRTGDEGVREVRMFSSRPAADEEYARILKEKTGKSKGYVEVALAASKVGSSGSAGTVDEATRERIAQRQPDAPAVIPNIRRLDPTLDSLVRRLYSEATGALLSTVQATITAKGVETPLGVLTLEQIAKGEAKLKEIFSLLKSTGGNDIYVMTPSLSGLSELSSEFYSLIPHKIGRNRAALDAAVIRSIAAVGEKQETLQLMRDMLVVESSHGSGALATDDATAKYEALRCEITPVHDDVFAGWETSLEKSRRKPGRNPLRTLWRVQRQGEADKFAPVAERIGNVRSLFHGSRARNWMGILSRGLCMPKVVQTMGISRTDGGWLGDGIYFGDAVCTSAQYASPSRDGKRWMAIANVALGKQQKYTKITYGLQKPADGYDSTHGVRGTQFADDEFVVYSVDQQCLALFAELS